jgi:hypothetical protein
MEREKRGWSRLTSELRWACVLIVWTTNKFQNQLAAFPS